MIGQNGSGKSNILSAIQYFYRNLTSVWEDEGIFDANNFFSNEIRIRVEYDLKNVKGAVEFIITIDGVGVTNNKFTVEASDRDQTHEITLVTGIEVMDGGMD